MLDILITDSLRSVVPLVPPASVALVISLSLKDYIYNLAYKYEYSYMNVPELKSFLAHNKEPIAVTAPLILQNTALIGLYTSVGDSYCAELPTSELKQIGELLYQPRDYPIVVHGLKRIWEFLDLNTDELDLKLVTDTKLLAYLLDPDAGETNGLTLTHLAYQYLGEEYPHVASEVQDKGVLQALRESLMRDAQVIWHLGQELPKHMSKDLLRLYHHLELPLMLVLDRMRRRRNRS